MPSLSALRRRPRRFLGPLVAMALSTPLPTVAAPPAAVVPPPGACAKNSGKAVGGTVFGQDGRDVNVSVGVDLVDGAGRALNADPSSPRYGCAKTGGYSVPQIYLNHFVGPQGAAPGALMKDGTRTRRDWRVGNVPANAVGAYVEVYSRGYQGSPCRDAAGNYCFNPPALSKYGYANKHLVPVGTTNLPVRLPTTCRFGGTAGSITGTVSDSAGRPVALRSVYAWTETKWNAPPFVHGWGSAQLAGTGSYTITSLASRQSYVVWATTTSGRTLKKNGVRVEDCRSTRLDLRG